MCHHFACLECSSFPTSKTIGADPLRNMSFGWSAGDLIAAIKLIRGVAQALDDVRGAKGEFNDTISYLGTVTRTLEPLLTFSSSSFELDPHCKKDIIEQVNHIKTPIQEFLRSARKYECSFGEQSRNGRLSNVRRKLQWRLFMTGEVKTLRSKTKDHLQVLDTLMGRLTLLVPFSSECIALRFDVLLTYRDQERWHVAHSKAFHSNFDKSLTRYWNQNFFRLFRLLLKPTSHKVQRGQLWLYAENRCREILLTLDAMTSSHCYLQPPTRSICPRCKSFFIHFSEMLIIFTRRPISNHCLPDTMSPFCISGTSSRIYCTSSSPSPS